MSVLHGEARKHKLMELLKEIEAFLGFFDVRVGEHVANLAIKSSMSILFEPFFSPYFWFSVAVKAYAASLEGHFTFDFFGFAISPCICQDQMGLGRSSTCFKTSFVNAMMRSQQS